ncbi:unnamed protein product, partial [Polarella glacialis]
MLLALGACNASTDAVSRHNGLWAVPVSRHRVPPDLIAALKPVILGLAKRSPGVRKSNRGGWHSASSALLGASEPLRSALLAAAGDYVQRVSAAAAASGGARLTGEVRLRLLGVWANVNSQGHSNVAHTHPGLLSGALYVAPGTSRGGGTELCLSDPRYLPADEGESSWRRSCSSLEQLDSAGGVGLEGLLAGDLVLFPSWLQHHVPPHKGDELRISVSFNVAADVLDPSGPLRLRAEGSETLLQDAPELVEMVELFGSDAMHQSAPDKDRWPELTDWLEVDTSSEASPTEGADAPRRSRPPPTL